MYTIFKHYYPNSFENHYYYNDDKDDKNE